MVIRKANRRPAPAGFTLVELLVVITIITILAGLITVAAFNAVRATRDFGIGQEIAQLKAAIEVYKNENGGYFPSTTDTAIGQALLKRHLRRARKNHREPDSVLQQLQLDPSEAMVFFLGGGAKLAEANSLSGTPPFIFVLEDEEYPLTGARSSGTATGRGRPAVYFDFDETRLVDLDGDGYPSYLSLYGEGSPLVYFNGGQYAAEIADNADFNTTDFGVVKPYKKPSVKNPGPANFDFIDQNSFQIISAGQDGHFGEYADPINGFKVFPDAAGFSIEDNDNISSFSDKGRFENSAL